MASVLPLESMNREQLMALVLSLRDELDREKKCHMEDSRIKDAELAEYKAKLEAAEKNAAKITEDLLKLVKDKFCKQKWKPEYPDQLTIYDLDEFGNLVDRTYTVSVGSGKSTDSSEAGDAEKSSKKKVHKAKKHTERIHYDGLEMKVVVLPVPDDMKTCPKCGGKMTIKGYSDTYEMAYQPGVLYIKKIRQPKLECTACQEHNEEGKSTVVTVKYNKLLKGSLLSSSLAARIILMRYQAGLPYYEIEKLLKTNGVRIPRQNLQSWMEHVASIILPLYYLMIDDIKKYDVIMMDETKWQVLREKGKIAQSNSYIWVMRTPPGQKDIIIYTYSPNRKGENAEKLLENWSGYLMTDGYSGYNNIKGATSLRCNVHAFRKFREALLILPAEHDANAPEEIAVRKYQEIIHAKNELRIKALELYPDDKARRDAYIEKGYADQIRPMYEKFFAWLEKASEMHSTSTFKRAVTYALNARDDLMRFTERCDLPDSNQLTEQAVRPLVVIRNRMQFNVSPEGAQADMILFSLMETALQNGCNPYLYFEHLLDNIRGLDPEKDADKIRQLLPYSGTLPENIMKSI